MRVLYLGANLRMKQSTYAAPEIRGRGLRQGLEQSGVEVIPLMAGDQLNIESTRSFYSKCVKRFLPQLVAATFRDLYEIYLDHKLLTIIEPQISKLSPDIILQTHTRYGQAGVKLSSKYHIPIFLDDITPIWEGEIYSDRSLKPIARRIRKRVFSQATGLNAVSHEMESELRSKGVPDSKIIFVPNGVDISLFNPEITSNEIRKKFNLSGKIVVGYVGTFAGWHKLDLLITVASRVVKSIPDIHFLMVGDERTSNLSEITRQQGIADLFTFPGSVPNEEIPSYINAMDFCVLPGTLPYMSPMKIFEYMAMGKPVIAPSGNSITESLVIPQTTGMLFEAGNPCSLAETIITFAAKPEIVKELGTKAKEFVVGNFTWYDQTRDLFKAFEAAIANFKSQGVKSGISINKYHAGF